jgi:phenylalanyl-tRNA synthetase alpha chain
LGIIAEDVRRIRSVFESELASAGNLDEIQKIRVRFLGRKGEVTSLLKRLGALPPEERPEAGRVLNELRDSMEEDISRKESECEGKEVALRESGEWTDVTLPGRGRPWGAFHPVAQIAQEAIDIFASMGFSVAYGPEVEDDFHNFEGLNIPPHHPARDMQDTFYIEDNMVLRTHTSPVQVRIMEKVRPPVRILSPGRVYRPDSDVSHTPMFHQIEGLLVDRGVSFADLKGILTAFLKKVFGADTILRFRPSFFPFTEPSAEVDIRCVMCGGKGCRVCGQSGWLEILGSGMVDPAVFQNVGYDAAVYSGFAFGLGLERIAMLKYGISDIRLLFENDIRFLKQF